MVTHTGYPLEESLEHVGEAALGGHDPTPSSPCRGRGTEAEGGGGHGGGGGVGGQGGRRGGGEGGGGHVTGVRRG